MYYTGCYISVSQQNLNRHWFTVHSVRRETHVLRGKVKHELRVASSNPRVTSSNLRVTSSNSWVTSSNPRVRRLKARVARLKARVEAINHELNSKHTS